MTAQLTAARKRALAVLLQAKLEDRLVRISNETAEDRIYWQSADWLIRNGLAETLAVGEYLALTAAGVDIARAL